MTTAKKNAPKPRISKISRLASAFDMLILSVFAVGVLFIVAMFIYVLSHEFSLKSH